MHTLHASRMLNFIIGPKLKGSVLMIVVSLECCLCPNMNVWLCKTIGTGQIGAVDETVDFCH